MKVESFNWADLGGTVVPDGFEALLAPATVDETNEDRSDLADLLEAEQM